MARNGLRVKVQNTKHTNCWENHLQQIFKTPLLVIHFKSLLTYHSFYNVTDSCLHARYITLSIGLQQTEIRISLRTVPSLLENLRTFMFYNNTQMLSPILLPLKYAKACHCRLTENKFISIELYSKNTFILTCDSLEYTLIIWIISFGTF